MRGWNENNLNETAGAIKSCVVYFVLLDYFQNNFKMLILQLGMIVMSFYPLFENIFFFR